MTQDEIFGHGHGAHGAEFLLHDGDAGGLRGAHTREGDGLTIDSDLTRVGDDQAGNDLNDGALTGTVLAKKGHYFTGLELEIYVGQCVDGTV